MFSSHSITSAYTRDREPHERVQSSVDRGLVPFQAANSFRHKLPSTLLHKVGTAAWFQEAMEQTTTSASVARTRAASGRAQDGGPRSSISWQRREASVENVLQSTTGHCRHRTHPHMLIQSCRNCFDLTHAASRNINRSDPVGAASSQHPPQTLRGFLSIQSMSKRCTRPR